jgi:hypothetical protein
MRVVALHMYSSMALIASLPFLGWLICSLWHGTLSHMLTSLLRAPPFTNEPIPFYVAMVHRLASYGYKYGRWAKGTKRVYELVRPSKDVLRTLHQMELANELNNANRAKLRKYALLSLKLVISFVMVTILACCLHTAPRLTLSSGSGCPVMIMFRATHALLMIGSESIKSVVVIGHTTVALMVFAMSHLVPTLFTTMHAFFTTLLAIIPAIAPMVDPCHSDGILQSAPEAMNVICVVAPRMVRSAIYPMIETTYMMIITLMDVMFRVIIGGVMVVNRNHTYLDQIRAAKWVTSTIIPGIPIMAALCMEWWRSAQNGHIGKSIARARYLLGWAITAIASYAISMIASRLWNLANQSPFTAWCLCLSACVATTMVIWVGNHLASGFELHSLWQQLGVEIRKHRTALVAASSTTLGMLYIDLYITGRVGTIVTTYVAWIMIVITIINLCIRYYSSYGHRLKAHDPADKSETQRMEVPTSTPCPSLRGLACTDVTHEAHGPCRCSSSHPCTHVVEKEHATSIPSQPIHKCGANTCDSGTDMGQHGNEPRPHDVGMNGTSGKVAVEGEDIAAHLSGENGVSPSLVVGTGVSQTETFHQACIGECGCRDGDPTCDRAAPRRPQLGFQPIARGRRMTWSAMVWQVIVVACLALVLHTVPGLAQTNTVHDTVAEASNVHRPEYLGLAITPPQWLRIIAAVCLLLTLHVGSHARGICRMVTTKAVEFIYTTISLFMIQGSNNISECRISLV